MSEDQGSGQQRYCTNCGIQVSPNGAFCGNCGTRVSSDPPDASATQELPARMHGRAGRLDWARLRPSDVGRDAVLGVLLAAACAGLMVAAIYAVFALRGTFSNPSVPGTAGLSLFALMHGGGASVDVPPIPSLFGLGGSIRLGLPSTTFVLMPFLASMLAARFLGHRARTVPFFLLAAALSYALIVAACALLGTASSGAGDLTVHFAPDPLSAAIRGFLWAGLGTTLGTAASRGPLLPAPIRQVFRGALWAIGISVALTLMLAVVAGLVPQGSGEPVPARQAAQQAKDTLTPSSPGAPSEGSPGSPSDAPQSAASLGDVLVVIGAVFSLLPVALGNLWLLAHGVPVGFQNAPDLGGIPMIGEALADVPLKVGLLGNWPWAGAWRLLLLAPAAGLLVGGMVAARGTIPGGQSQVRWQRGALVALPYAAIALLAAVLFGASADATLGEAARLEVAFRASLGWLLLLLPAGAALGAFGGLLGGLLARGARGDAFPAPRPNLAFIATAIAAGAVLLVSLPALAALGPGVSQPAAPADPMGSGGQPFSSPPSSGSSSSSSSGSSEPTTTTETADGSQYSDGETPPPSTEVVSEADPAFDSILPTLRQTTSAPIMLPAELPEELQNVAVDADQGGDRYGILSLYRPSGNAVESYVHANNAGTLTVATEPPDTVSEYFEATSEETVELSDGTEATLRYMEPKEGEMVNQVPFWEGSFERDGYTYTLRVPLEDPSGEIARQALSSMVEVPGFSSTSPPGSTSPGPDTVNLEADAEEAAGDYYRASGVGDWNYTYENLDSSTQSNFTREEWFQKNQWFADNGSVIYDIISVERQGGTRGPIVEVLLRLTYEDGSPSTRTTYFIYEDEDWKHRFGEEENGLFMPDASYDEFVAAQQ